MRILFLSHTHASGDFVVGSHHLSRELAERGHEVAHISSPYSLLHSALRRGAAGRREASLLGWHEISGVKHLVPRTLLPSNLSARRTIEHAVADLGWRTAGAILIDQPRLVAPGLHRYGDRVIYRPTDLYFDRLSLAGQRSALAQADGVVATSDEVLTSLHLPDSLKATVIPNGVELDPYEQAGSLPAAKRAGVIYVGALDDRFDWNAVTTLANRAPATEFLLVGPQQGNLDPATLPPNVKLHGRAAYTDIPRLLQRAKVGLLPLNDNPLNAGRSPMKLHEYGASGLFVVARRTGPLERARVPGAMLYDTVDEAAAGLEKALGRPGENSEGRRHALEEGWAAKAARLEAFIRGMQ